MQCCVFTDAKMNEWMNSASKQHMRTQSVIEQMLQTWIRNLQKSVTDRELSVCWRRRSLSAELQSQHWWGGASETGSYLLWHHHHWTAPLITPEHKQLRLSLAVLTYPVRSRQVCSGVLQVGQNITPDWTEGNCRGRGSRDSRMRMEARLKSTRLTNLLNLNSSLGERHRQTEKKESINRRFAPNVGLVCDAGLFSGTYKDSCQVFRSFVSPWFARSHHAFIFSTLTTVMHLMPVSIWAPFTDSN